MAADIQLPNDGDVSPRLLACSISSNAIAPETSRTVEKLAASMEPSASARRHSTELPANAIRASVVRVITLILLVSEVGFDVTIK